MKCQNCNSELNPGALFCKTCGSKVEAAPIEKIPVKAPEPVSVPQQPKSGGGGKIAVIIILAALLSVTVIIAAVAIFILFAKDDKEVEAPKVEVQVVMPEEEKQEKQEVIVYESERDEFFPSDRRYITSSDLAGKTKEEVAMIRNEIYARHGYEFKTEPYKSYFGAKSWYHKNPYFSESDFNKIEKANKEYIVQYEKDRGWR